MKNLIVSILVMMNAIISNAQTTWVKNMSKYIGAYSDIYQLKKDSSYLVSGYSKYILNIDSLGNLIKTIQVNELNNDNSFEAGIINLNSKLYGAGCIAGYGLFYNNIYIKATNEQGDDIWHYDFGDSMNDNRAMKIVYKNNYLHVLSVKNYGEPNSNINVTKLDTNGNIQFTKDIPSDNVYKYFRIAMDFQILNDSSYVILADKQKWQGQPNPWFLRLDKNGDTLFSKFTGLNMYLARINYRSSVLLNDTFVITVGGKSDSANITKYDLSGNIIWEKNYYCNPKRYRELIYITNTYDHNLIACGYKFRNGIGSNSNLTLINIVKFDTAGNIIWEKDYKLSEESSDVFKIIPTFDGGYIMIGFLKDSTVAQKEYTIVIKLDSLGNFDFVSAINTITKSTESISLYPNPTNAIINIQALHPEEIKTITLYNINGSLINTYPYDSKSIDLSEYANGNYYLKLQYQNSFETKKIIKL
jgi:hypothetical protein